MSALTCKVSTVVSIEVIHPGADAFGEAVQRACPAPPLHAWEKAVVRRHKSLTRFTQGLALRMRHATVLSKNGGLRIVIMVSISHLRVNQHAVALGRQHPGTLKR
jgi:hypothetical protein